MKNSATSWLDTFGISNRLGTPDLLMRRDAVVGAPHATAIDKTFSHNVDAFLAIQDVPTVAFAVREELDLEEIDQLHKALWNQGLASLLVVRLPTEVRVYSVWERLLGGQCE